LAFSAYGVRVGVRTNQLEALAALEPFLPRLRTPLRSPVVSLLYSLRVGGEGPRPGLRNYHLVYGLSQRVARTHDLRQAMEALGTDLQAFIALRAPRRVFVHAGVVGWRGQAILLPGRSYTGKSTLVVALVRAGATYYSDEYAVLDEQGRVHPYPLPINMRSGAVAPSQKIPPEALGARTGRKPLPVGLVLSTEFHPEARWRPRALSPAAAVHALLSNTVPAQLRPASVLPVLGQVARQARVLKGNRPEADLVAGALLNGDMV